MKQVYKGESQGVVRYKGKRFMTIQKQNVTVIIITRLAYKTIEGVQGAD